MKKSKRVGVFLAGVFLATFLGTLVGCGESATQPDGSGGEPQEQQPQGKDTLLVENMRTELGYSEDFKTGGAFSVTLKRADGTERVLKESEYTVDSSAVQKGVPGTYDVKVTAEGLETSYPVKVLEKQKWEEDGVLKVFMIGNSFSVDAITHAYNIAKDLGIKAVFANLAIGACTIDQHIQYFSEGTANYDYYLYSDEETSATQKHVAKEELQSDNWDFITIQDMSMMQGWISAYANVGQFFDIVNEWKNPEAEVLWHMTWADQADSLHNYFGQMYQRDQMKEYNMILSCVQSEIVDKLGVKVIPNGTAIQNARTSFFGDTLTRDGHHLDEGAGRYIAGLTLFSKLTGRSVEGISWMPEQMHGSVKQRAVAVESAMNAIKTPFAITQSKYTK